MHSSSLASGFTQLFGKNAEAAKAKLQQIGLELLKQVVAQMMHSPSKLQSQFSAQQPAEEKMYLFPRPKLQTAAQQLAEPLKHEFIRPQPQHFAAPPQQPPFAAPPQPQPSAEPPQSHAQPQLALPPLESPAGHSPQQSQSVPQSSPEVTPEKAAYWAEPVAYEGPRLSMGGVRPSEAREHAKLLKQHLNDGQLKELHSDLLALSNTATEDMKSAFDEKYKNVFESKYDDNPAAFSVLGKVGLKESGGMATDSKFWSLASTHTPRN